MASWELLDERGESELHKSRLLNVEEKPFKRITKRLASISAVVSGAVTPKSTNQNGNGNGNGNGNQNGNANLNKSAVSSNSILQEDLTLDFAAFDSSIARLQFLHDANVRERERYGADKQRILGECHSARETNARLREQLEAARTTLAQRKKFDELAEKILSNRMLKPREDQVAALARLEEECRELERESETYSGTWRERRDQFNRIMEEGMLLRRQIRDEKEEVDRREGMVDEDAAEAAEEDAAAAEGGATPGMDPGATGTPRPDRDGHLIQGGNGNGRDTPVRDSMGPEGSLRVPTLQPGGGGGGGGGGGAASRNGSRASTREPSAPPQHHDESGDEDVNMDEERERNGDKMELDR